MAGVAEMLCEPGDRVLQLRQFDPFGFGEHYKVTTMFDTLQEVITEAQRIQTDYDIIVIHDYQEFKTYFPKKKVRIIFHGTKLRTMDIIVRESCREYECYVTTNDLLEILPNATWLPAPIDVDMFTFNEAKVPEDWICLNRSYQRDVIEPIIKAKYPKIKYFERNAENLMDYEDMPMFLTQYSDVVDWKFTYDKPTPKSLPDVSCTGLQALAAGCNVWDRNGNKLSRDLLLIHDMNRVRKRFRDAN